MSSVSCVLVKDPSSMYGDGSSEGRRSEEYNALSAFMWTLGSLLVSFNVEMSKNNTDKSASKYDAVFVQSIGVLVSVTFLNVILMLIATLLLGKGLKESNPSYVLPWVVVSFWSMYHIQFEDISKLFRTVRLMSAPSKLLWCTLITYGFSLVVRFHLTVSVAYVALQQWYNKKLVQEVKASAIRKR